ncbi:MAG: RnfABCDGE type electron transport complex subunit B [Candidatus Omnitrophota bacterium]|jgi:RnfABCDGE-type electron transport complex B subunit|nr:MAG: RnfABCDGE type electron transport complex subunit B [Candidatus Omnitrophota bacterium]
MNILIPVLIVTILGLVFGILLALASRRFCVEVDPRLDKIYSKLPGANCGACGMPGCMGFAEALIQGTCTIDRCAVTEQEVRKEIAEILGVEHTVKIKRAAVLHCHGGNKRVKNKFDYVGIQDCISANIVMSGPKACVYGCIGYGTCAKVCPFGAIEMSTEDLPVVNEDKCTACGKCVAACPKGLFSLVSVSKNFAVRCKSLDMGKKVMDVCSVGCIACRKCEKACPVKAIRIENNLSIIDYSLCDNRGQCFKVCPTKSIAIKENKSWRTKAQGE